MCPNTVRFVHVGMVAFALVLALVAGCGSAGPADDAVGGAATAKADLLNPVLTTDETGAADTLESSDVLGTAEAADPADPTAADDATGTDDDAAAAADDDATDDVVFGLTEEQRAQIDDLRAQFDAGTITSEQFAAQVDAILGDEFSGGPFGERHFFGFGFGHFGHHIIRRLDLTDEQQTAAEDLFAQSARAVRLLTIEAMADTRLVLTPEQRAEIDSFREERIAEITERIDSFGHFGRDAVRMRGFGHGRGHGGFPGGFHRGGFHHGHRPSLDRILTGDLALTDAQQTQIAAIHTQLLTDTQTEGQSARDAFRALLTPEQQATYDEWAGRFVNHFGSDADDELTTDEEAELMTSTMMELAM